jgi:hypothetical protein
MRKTSTAIWMRVHGEARAKGIGVRLAATRKIGAEELGTRIEVRASSIKLKRRYRAKTRGREEEKIAGREGKTNHHGGGGGNHI